MASSTELVKEIAAGRFYEGNFPAGREKNSGGGDYYPGI